MKGWMRWLLVTLFVGSIAFVLTPSWPIPASAPQPPPDILPFFVALVSIESMAFGLGVSFVVFGRGMLNRIGGPAGLTNAAYLSVAFLLLNWWPHDNLHRMTSGDWNGLLMVEYGFHLPLMVAGAVLAWFFVSLAMRSVRDVDPQHRVLVGVGK